MKQPFKVLATSLLAGAMLSSSFTAFAAEEALDSSKQAQTNELPPLDIGATSTPFKDVKYGTEVFNAVKYFQHTGVINGLTENYFGVNEAIKRVDAAMIVGKSAPLDSFSTPQTHPFKDVPERAKSIIAQLYQLKVMNGKTPTKFGSDENITRGEAAILISRAYMSEIEKYVPKDSSTGDVPANWNDVSNPYDPVEKSNKFTDVTGRYVESVDLLVEAGVINGKSETKFGTYQQITRGELIMILHRLTKLEENQKREESVDYPSTKNGVALSLDKEVYSPSDEVKITLTNTSDQSYTGSFKEYELEIERDGIWYPVPLRPEMSPTGEIVELDAKDGVDVSSILSGMYFEAEIFPAREFRLVQRLSVSPTEELVLAAKFKVVE